MFLYRLSYILKYSLKAASFQVQTQIRIRFEMSQVRFQLIVEIQINFYI